MLGYRNDLFEGKVDPGSLMVCPLREPSVHYFDMSSHKMPFYLRLRFPCPLCAKHIAGIKKVIFLER
jgi:hypothetical protein